MSDDQLNQILELTKENNKILRGMQRTARIGKFFRAIYWILILGSIFGTYYYLQPYIDQLLRTYNDVISTVQNVKNKAANIPDPNSLKLPPQILQRLDSTTKTQ